MWTEHPANKYNSNQFIIYRIFNGISTLCAGLALYLGYRKAYFISAATGLITLFFTLKLVEVRVGEDPAKDKDVSTKAMAKKLIEYFAESIRFLFRNPKAAKLMFLNSFVGAIDILLLFFLQSKIRDAGISNVFLGVALFTMELGGVVGSKLIVKFKKVKYAYLFIICTIGVLAGVVLEHSGIVPIMTLGGFIASLADDAIEIRTAAKLHDMFPGLSEKAFGVLEVLKAHPGLKAEDIGVQVSLSERQVKTYLNALKQAGLIVRVGSNKTGYWKVTIDNL